MKLFLNEWTARICRLDVRARLAIAVILSGALWFASTGVNHIWPLAWIAPVPLLLLLPDLGVGRSALAAFMASLLGALNLVFAYQALPPVVLVIAVLMVAIPFTAVALTWRAIARNESPLVAILAYPVLIVIAEFLVTKISPNGTFGSLAYSQADVTPLIQLVSVTGIWGVSFLVTLVPAALALMWRHRSERQIVYSALAVMLLPLAAVLAFGFMRLAQAVPVKEVKVGLVTHDAAIPYFATQDSINALIVVQQFAGLARKLAESGTEVIVLPEKFVGVTPANFEEAIAVFGKIARDHHVTIVAGFNLQGEERPRNLALAIGTQGYVVLGYDKMHLVPGVEDGYKVGTDIGLMPAQGGIFGIAICKDMDFISLGRSYANMHTSLMLVPAWDFVNDGWLHSRMAMVRGVEAGFSVARSAAQGLVTVSDAHGRMLAQRSSGEAPDVVLAATVSVPVEPTSTFYARTGDWLVWLCVGVLFIVGFRLLENRRARRALVR